MNTAAKLTLTALGGACLAGLALWWFADHRRGIAWAVSVVRRRFPDVSHLSPAALDAWRRDARRPAPQIVDARSEEEFEASHLLEARRIDPESTAAAALALLDPERPVVVYCSAGYRGATLARRLQNAGRRDVWNLEGGIFAWANADLPLTRIGQPVRRVHPYSRLFSRLLKPQKRPLPFQIPPFPNMKTIQIYDPPMCCSTGICGPNIDPDLVNFAAMLSRLGTHGIRIERYNLGQQPMAFVQNPAVKALLDTEGTMVLPLIFLDGEVYLKGRYPTKEERPVFFRAALGVAEDVAS